MENEKIRKALSDFASNTLISKTSIQSFLVTISLYSISSLSFTAILKSLETEIHNIVENDVSEGDNIVSEIYLHLLVNGVSIESLVKQFITTHNSDVVKDSRLLPLITLEYGKLISVAIAIKLYNTVLVEELKLKKG